MEGTPAVYLDRIVSKDNFRVYIYAPDGVRKLVRSWDEFELHMQTGLWFATRDAMTVSLDKSKRSRKPVKSNGDIEPVKESV